jgi:DNA-binding beta-propeller fold protein YncE/DNA-directed RNA polymerase subunit RPC12/RpoP
MSEAQLFKCPSCGAPLHPAEDAETFRCPYCNNTVIVPPGMRGEAVTPAAQASLGAPMVSVSTAPPVTVDGKKIGKAVGVVGVSLTCVVVAAVLLILGAVLVSLYFAFGQSGVSLAPLLTEAVPASIASVELQFGTQGIGAGQLSDPRAIAADRERNIYVGDYITGRLQAFDSQGNFLWLANLGEDQYIQALEADDSGVLLLVSRGSIRRFDAASGAELEPFPNPDNLSFEDLNLAPDGRLAVIVDGEDIYVFDASYNQILHVPQAVSSVTNDSELDADIDIDGLGNLYVLGGFNSAVLKYTPDGRFANRISSSGDQPGQLTAPSDLAVDGQGRLFVSDFNGVQVFAADGRYVDQFDPGGAVFGLNFDAQNRLYTISNLPGAMRYRLNP